MARLDWYIRANLKLRHLQLLVALDDLRSVRRVAAHLNVTQPAVSKTLAALETGLAATLFERTARGIEPTEMGACLIRHAREILRQLMEAQSDLRDIGEGKVTRVSLGVLPSTAVFLVPRAIARLEAHSAAVAVSVREGAMDTLLPSLRANDIDFAVGVMPDRPLGIEFGHEILIEDPIVPVVRRGHPLTRSKRLGWHMIDGYPMVLPPQSAYTRRAIDSFFAQHRVAVSSRHLDSLSTMTNVGTLQFTDSIGFLSRLLAMHFASLGLLSILPLDVPEATMRIGLIWMMDRRLNKAQQTVAQVFRETRDALLHEYARAATPPRKAAATRRAAAS